MNQLYNCLIKPEQDVGRESITDNLVRTIESRPVPLPLPYTCLDNSSKFLWYGDLKIIGGSPSTGKSIFALSLGLNCTNYQVSWRYLPLESDRNFHLLRSACLLDNSWDALSENISVAGMAIKRVRGKLEKLSEAICNNPALPDVNSYSQHITPEYILQWVEEQFKSGVKVVIVDPMAQIDFLSGRVSQYQSENSFIQKAVTLAHKYQTCFVLVVHTIKRYENTIPDMSDLQGGASLSRLASSILILHDHNAESKAKLGNSIFVGNGYTREVEFNRIIHIAKSRNSSGSGLKIAFNFENAYFEELGFFAPKSQRKPEPKPDKFNAFED